MAIKKKDRAADFISLSGNHDVNNELADSPDRTAAIIGATILDVRLERLLRKFFVDDQKEVDSLLSNMGTTAPLSSLSARARTAYCLGLICKEEFLDIGTVRDIRNICAHHLFDCDFENPAIKAATNGFRIFSNLMKSPEAAPTRVKFNIAVGILDRLLQERLSYAVSLSAATPFHGTKVPGEPSPLPGL